MGIEIKRTERDGEMVQTAKCFPSTLSATKAICVSPELLPQSSHVCCTSQPQHCLQRVLAQVVSSCSSLLLGFSGETHSGKLRSTPLVSSDISYFTPLAHCSPATKTSSGFLGCSEDEDVLPLCPSAWDAVASGIHTICPSPQYCAEMDLTKRPTLHLSPLLAPFAFTLKNRRPHWDYC